MRVCMVISTPFPPEEGIGYHVYNLSKKLIERGHEITVITRGGLRTEKMNLDGIDVLKAPFVPLYPFHVSIHGFFLNRLFKKIEKNFDLVHIHTPLSPVIKTSLPIVSTIHTSVIEDAKHIEVVDLKSFGTKVLTKLVSYPLVSKLIDESNVVTTVATSVASELKSHYGYDKALVVGNGVDEKTFKPTREKNKGDYILYVGRLSYRKGVFDLLDCAKKVCQNYDVKFLLVGKGELEERIRKEIQKEELQGKIKLMGHVDREKLIQLYQQALIFLVPSHYEGLPTVLLEAMACGLPVVATDVSGNKDVVKNGENGLLIPPKSPQKMAEAISMLIEDEELRNKLGKNARKTIEEKFSWDVVADNVLQAYKLAMGDAK